MINEKKGFTLTELVVTLIVFAILALIIIPAYRGYVKRGVATEGKSLLNEINAAQQIYYSRNGQYYAGTAGQQMGASFGVDTKRNKYFTSYRTVTDGDKFTAYADYQGKQLTLKGSLTEEPEIIDNYSNEDD